MPIYLLFFVLKNANSRAFAKSVIKSGKNENCEIYISFSDTVLV